MADRSTVTSFSSAAMREAMLTRRAQLKTRVVLAGLMALVFFPNVGLRLSLEWAMAAIGLQCVEALVFSPARIERFDSHRAWRRAAWITVALSNVVFSLFGMIEVLNGGVALSCGVIVITGAAINAVLTSYRCPQLMWAAGGPVLLSAAAIPVGSYVHDQSIVNAALLLFGIVLYLVIVGQTWGLVQKFMAAERLARQAAEASDAAKSMFLANMSHELRTPLNGILGMASVLAQTRLAPAQTDMVETIQVSAHTLQTLLSDVLDLAKIEAGQISLQSEVVIPGAVARNVAALFGATAATKGLELVLDLDGSAERAVSTDSVRMTQILSNLCGNAVKFTDRGRVTISVRVAQADDRARVTFAVSDTGIGMSDEGRARLFQRFAQADGSITRRFGGTGLGLSICKQLSELMGGSIEVASVEGEGSTFTAEFDLPCAEAPPAALQSVRGATTLDTTPDGRPRVLLVEDHPINRKVVMLMLADFAEVDSAIDGEEGLRAATTCDYDVILMDMQMPVMDGLTATAAIRAHERRSGAPRTPIVMLTANAMAEHVKSSEEAGADLHLAKPITADALLNAIDRALAMCEPQPDLSQPALSMAG